MQKARRHPGQTIGLRPLVSNRFQELFHSPPGVLFSFRSRYSSLSVYQEYLALEGGPPMFTPGFTGLALLWNSLGVFPICIPDYHRLWCSFPTASALSHTTTSGSKPRRVNPPVWAIFHVRSPLLAESLLISFPPVTEMFQFSGFAPFRVREDHSRGLPHSEIRGSTLWCSSPRLIAA